MARRKKQQEGDVTVRCVAPNVWTRRGKLLKGDEAVVSREEAALLGDKVEIV